MTSNADERTELISEFINMLAGPVSSGIRAAGQANQRRIELQHQLEEAAAEFRRMAQVAQRMVALLDDIEGPLREAIPQLSRAARVLGDVLDAAPDDIGRQFARALASLNGLADGLGPLLLLAQGAAGMFGQRPPSAERTSDVQSSATSAVQQTPAPKKASSNRSTAKKAVAKQVSPRASAAKKTGAKKSTSARARS